ncbi:MAG: hypothetical protein ACFHWZ_01360 [Phycisphaerales bacterium]
MGNNATTPCRFARTPNGAHAVADACSAIGGASVGAVAAPRIRIGLRRLLGGRSEIGLGIRIGHDDAQYARADPDSRCGRAPERITRLR